VKWADTYEMSGRKQILSSRNDVLTGSNLGRAREGCCGGVYAGGLDESEFPDEKNLLIPNMIPLRCGVRFSVAMGLSFVKMQSRKFAKPSISQSN
jgi:hypothetical protein